MELGLILMCLNRLCSSNAVIITKLIIGKSEIRDVINSISWRS